MRMPYRSKESKSQRIGTGRVKAIPDRAETGTHITIGKREIVISIGNVEVIVVVTP